jgi:hypothetical protein
MNLIPLDQLVEIWAKAHEEALAMCAQDDDLGWWREAMANLRPTDEHNEILEAEDEDEKR